MTALPTPFWRLYASSATSNLADGIGRTALPLLAATLTRDPLLVSGLTTFAFLPWLLLALPSGAIVDRVDRRVAMIVANLVRAAASGALVLLIVFDAERIVLLYVIAFVLGAAETVYDSASRALLPQLVEARDLDRANSLLTVEESLGGTFLGAPIGSALFALAVALPVALNAGGFALAALLLTLLPGHYRPQHERERTSLRADIADGVRWLRGHDLLRRLTLVSAATAFSQNLCDGVLVLYVLDVLHLPAGNFGLVLLAAGAGALLGGVATPRLVVWFGRGPALVAGGVLSAVTTGAMGLVSNGYLGAALFAASAFGVMIWNVITMSMRQALIPQHMFGRVQGAYRTLVWGGIPLGALAGGVLANVTSVPIAFVVSGVCLLLMSGMLARVVRAHRTQLAELSAPEKVLA